MARPFEPSDYLRRIAALPGRGARGGGRYCALAFMLLLALAAFDPAVAQQETRFDIDQQRADQALIQFAQTANLSVLLPTEGMRDRLANSLYGEYSISDGLHALLRGTGLTARLGSSGQILVELVSEPEPRLVLPSPTRPPLPPDQREDLAVEATDVEGVGTPPEVNSGVLDRSGNPMMEIIVTARKREENLQDVPISISALSGAQFDQFDIRKTDDIEAVFANLSTNRQSSYNSGFAIRGVGTDNFHISGQQSVGTYIDDVSMVSPFVSTIGVYDIDRVEILRGPQNTLYGRNTTGGAVLWHTNKANPGDGTNGYGRLRVGNGGLIRFEGAAGFDLGEEFAARIAVLSDNYDGLWTSVLDGSDTGGGYDRKGARIHLQWDDAERARAGLTVFTGDTEGEDFSHVYRGNRRADGTTDPGIFDIRMDQDTGRNNNFVAVSAADVAARPFLQDQFDRGTGMVIVNPEPGPLNRLVNYSTEFGTTWQDPEDGHRAEWNGVRLNLEYSFTNIDFVSLTSWDETYILAKNGTDLTGFKSHQEGDWQVWQQEFRFASTMEGPLNWLAGLYFTDSDSTEDTWVSNTAAARGMGVIPGVDINSSYQAWSAYGEMGLEVSERLTFVAGLRYTEDELSADGENWVRTVCGFFPSSTGSGTFTRDQRLANCDGAIRLAGNTDSPKLKLSERGWRIGADYHFNDRSMLWASFSQGFKGGSYDNRALSTGDDPVGPEFITAWEVGYKGGFARNTLQVNAAAYFYEWEDLQLFEVIGGVPSLVNVPGTELKGVELELKWAPDDRWYIQGSIGTVDSKITDVTGINPASQAQPGKEVTNTPDLTANLFGSYSIPVGDSSLDLSLNYRYVSSVWYTFAQDSVRDESSSHSFLNARAAYEFGSQRQYSVALWGENLTKEFACSGLSDGPGTLNNWACEVSAYGEALWGLTLEARFGN